MQQTKEIKSSTNCFQALEEEEIIAMLSHKARFRDGNPPFMDSLIVWKTI